MSKPLKRTRSTNSATPKTVVITGAASGIGAAAARESVARGHRVAICDINLDAARALSSELGSSAHPVTLDVRSTDSWQSAWAEVTERFGTVDVLVNNAGIIHTGYVRDLSIDQHRDMVDVNYFGIVNSVLTVLPLLRAQGYGQIINVCSMSSFLPLTGYATYGATKHAMRGFHHALAMEERDGPIRFSLIHPPSVQTPMLDQERLDPSAIIAFAEKAVAPEVIGRCINDAMDTNPREVVFPRYGGRFQRLAGSNPALMYLIMPAIERFSTARERLRRRP